MGTGTPMKSCFFRFIAACALALLVVGCASQPPPIELGWICGSQLFEDFPPSEKPCTGTKDLALSGEALPPAGD